MNKKIKKIIYFWICAIIIFTKECYGYLDPSGMTYIIQTIAAVGITVATSIGIFIYKIRKFFRNKRERKQNDDENN